MKRISYVAIALVVLAAGYVIGSLGTNTAGAAKPQDPPAQMMGIPQPTELSTTFSVLVKRLQTSVVTITCTVGQRASARSNRDEEEGDNMDEMLRRFFGGNGGRQPRGIHMGSGVIVDPAGYIITNQHVVDKADRIQVKLFDNPTEYEAKLIGQDKETDLAVIHIEAGKKLPPAAIGNSDAVQVGEWAIAIGAPFGFETSVTSGIISAKGRDLGSIDPDHPLPRFLQTDAAINQGNSGGPLLNIRGEVIGINTMLVSNSRSGGFEGVGFAIPINMVAKVYNDIIRIGKVSRGAIGVSFNPQAKPELLKAYGADEGVFVEQVTPGGPAEKAGIKVGDVITKFQGKPVKNGDDLLGRVQEIPVGTVTDVTVLRDGKELGVKLEVADRAELSAAAANARPGRQEHAEGSAEAESAPVRFGLSVQEITAAERKELNFSGKTGILVTSVEPGSFAEDIGIREGDVITDMNRQPIHAIADLKRLQAGLKAGDAVAFRVLRNTTQGGSNWQTLFLAGTVPSK